MPSAFDSRLRRIQVVPLRQVIVITGVVDDPCAHTIRKTPVGVRVAGIRRIAEAPLEALHGDSGDLVRGHQGNHDRIDASLRIRCDKGLPRPDTRGRHTGHGLLNDANVVVQTTGDGTLLVGLQDARMVVVTLRAGGGQRVAETHPHQADGRPIVSEDIGRRDPTSVRRLVVQQIEAVEQRVRGRWNDLRDD